MEGSSLPENNQVKQNFDRLVQQHENSEIVPTNKNIDKLFEKIVSDNEKMPLIIDVEKQSVKTAETKLVAKDSITKDSTKISDSQASLKSLDSMIRKLKADVKSKNDVELEESSPRKGEDFEEKVEYYEVSFY